MLQKPITYMYRVYTIYNYLHDCTIRDSCMYGMCQKLYSSIRQNIRGGKLSRFSRILAKRKCFTIETFPASQLENNYRSQ